MTLAVYVPLLLPVLVALPLLMAGHRSANPSALSRVPWPVLTGLYAGVVVSVAVALQVGITLGSFAPGGR